MCDQCPCLDFEPNPFKKTMCKLCGHNVSNHKSPSQQSLSNNEKPHSPTAPPPKPRGPPPSSKNVAMYRMKIQTDSITKDEEERFFFIFQYK